MDYDLGKLIAWTRNACGDRPRLTTEELVGTGEDTLTLSNTGGITLGRVTVDGEEVALDTVTVEDNLVTFSSPPDADADVQITYALTRYTDDDIRTFLADAAVAVASDLPASLPVQRTSAHIDVPDSLWQTTSGEPDAVLVQLIVYKAALDIMSDKGNQAADDAITIRDDDTTIDTSRTSQNTEIALRRLTARYDQALMRAKHRKLSGAALVNGHSKGF